MTALAEHSLSTDALTEAVIGCAISVHKALGPGLLESSYENALAIELRCCGIPFEQQKTLPVSYRDQPVGEFRIDMLVSDELVLELKSTEKHNPLYEAQLLTYLKLGRFNRGLIINFNSRLLKDGIKRMVL